MADSAMTIIDDESVLCLPTDEEKILDPEKSLLFELSLPMVTRLMRIWGLYLRCIFFFLWLEVLNCLQHVEFKAAGT